LNSDPRDPGAMGEDDLFDLPTEAASANELTDPALAASGAGVVPLPPLPRRPERAGPAGPPLPSVPSTVEAILGQVRKRPARTEATPTAPAEEPVVATARIQVPRAVWMALGGLAIVNVAVLAFVLRGPASDRPADGGGPPSASMTSIVESPAAVHPEPKVQEQRASAPSLPPVLPGGSVLERAQQTLADARADIESGRRGSARARLGRLGLAIDGIDPANRESIRPGIGLLLAESTQADADEARRSKR
jgi:hypothetical protein